MIKRRTLVRLTRFWLAFYIMTWCMTFTMSDVALASSLPDDMDMKILKIYSLQNASFAEIGSNVSSGFLLHNNGSKVFENVTAVFGSTTDVGGGALQVIKTPLVVNNTRFINNTNEPTGGAINIQFINNTSIDSAAYNTTFINNTSTGGAVYNTQSINNTWTGGAVYIEDGYVTVNENTFINNTGSYQAIDQDFEEVLGNVTGRGTVFHWGLRKGNVSELLDGSIYMYISDVIGHEFEDDRTVDLWKIERINPGETAVIMFTQNVTQNDVFREKIDNTVYVIGPGTGYVPINVTQTIWTSDPITITFDDSFTVTNKTIHSGSPIGSLPIPEKEGYIFNGWYTENGKKVGPQDVFFTSTKLVARWKIIVAFYDDRVQIEKRAVDKGTVIGPFPVREKEGYILDGWYTDPEGGVKVGPDTVANAPMNLYARWDIIIAFYDGGAQIDSRTVHKGAPIGPLPILEKEGYIFDGWYTESGDKVGPEDGFSTPTKLVARWKIIVAFYDDRVQIEKRSVDKGTVIGSFPDREKEGYILDGWYTAPEGGEKAFPDTVVNAPMNLYARWVEREKPAEVSLPQTGDQWNVWLYAGIGIVAVIGLVVLILRRRK